MPDVDETHLNAELPEGDEDLVQKLRKQANAVPKLYTKIDTLQAENTALKQRVAFADAGLTLTDRQRTALLAVLDGETTTEALRAGAAELGFIQADEPDADAAAREAALKGQQSIATASSGARPPAPTPPLDQRIADAERAGADPKETLRLKAQWTAQQARMGLGGSVPVS